MTQPPDFSSMTKEEIGDWFLHADTNAVLAKAERPSEPMVHVIVPEEKPIRVPRHPNPPATADRRPAPPSK
jgi:hypothetical protein